jgi:hypothetical protein
MSRVKVTFELGDRRGEFEANTRFDDREGIKEAARRALQAAITQAYAPTPMEIHEHGDPPAERDPGRVKSWWERAQEGNAEAK